MLFLTMLILPMSAEYLSFFVCVSSIFFNKIFIIFMHRFFISLVKLEKEMATHSSILAWKIQRKEESGRLQSLGSQRVGHD